MQYNSVSRGCRQLSLLVALVVVFLWSGCDDGGDGDADADVDGDGDVDADGDGDGDGDGDSDVDGDADGWVDADYDIDQEDPPAALLEIYVLDIWAQPLPAEGVVLEVSLEDSVIPTTGFPVATAGLRDAGTYEIVLTSPHHVPLEVYLQFDGSSTHDGASLFPTSGSVGHGISLSHDEWTLLEGGQLPRHTLFLGQRHQWFSAQGRPARRGNHIELLMDGEEAWTSVHDDLLDATDLIMVSTWWWESTFELIRDEDDHMYSTQEERRQNTILSLLEDSVATKRVLVGQFLDQDGLLTWMTSDLGLRAHGDDPSDDFEFMGQANESSGEFWFEVAPFMFDERLWAAFPEIVDRDFEAELPIESEVTPHRVDLTDWPIDIDIQHASYHQKFFVLDTDLAYVGGMNLRRVDWDTRDHYVFEERRMLFDATTEDRVAVAAREMLPDNGPRKDYMVRVEGPSAQDVADVFHNRWAEVLALGVDYSENASDFSVGRDIEPRAGGVQAQVTATLPEPFWEHAIAETWFNAVGMAEQYIFIEDQYFRIPLLADAIIDRMNAVPDLRLIVVTKPVSEWTDPGCEWTYRTTMELGALFPGRFALYQLRAFDYELQDLGPDETRGYFEDIDVHSKMLIVDDLFLSVGSANKNNRGIIYEGELNVAILDPEWVRLARRRIFQNILPPGALETDTVDTFWEQFVEAAAWNQFVWENWDAEGFDINLDSAPLPDSYRPEGLVYPLDFGIPSDCAIEGMGEDMV